MYRRQGLVHGLVAVLIFLLPSCAWRDWSRSLPGGYELAHTMADYVVISHVPSHEVVVEGNVRRYKVLDTVIVGYAGKAPAVAGPVRTGYFIIELKGSGKVYQGLDKKQWLARLRQCGVRHQPRLEEVPAD